MSVRKIVALIVLAAALAVAVRLLSRPGPAPEIVPAQSTTGRAEAPVSAAVDLPDVAREAAERETPDTAGAAEPDIAYVRGPGGLVVVIDDAGGSPAYRVLASDAAGVFGVGDRITHIDGAPVEISPAGSELLLIAVTTDPSRLTIEPAE